MGFGTEIKIIGDNITFDFDGAPDPAV